MLSGRYGRVFVWTALLAILFASVGSHIVHPAFHEHPHVTAAANDGSPSASLRRCAGSQEADGRVGDLCGWGPCPICLLLAAFQADCPLPVGLLPCTDAVPARRRPRAVPAVQIPFWAAHAARAPPLSQPV
jgi:hypothetical protein